jgi:ABC-2 type transport system ATP-binding protein
MTRSGSTVHPSIDAAAIDVRGLRKAYGGTVVLDGVDFTVPRGSVAALLGPNGAGKTTTVQILSTLIPADAGRLSVAGHDVGREPEAVRRAIGVTGQFSAVDGLLTGAENLALIADLLHLDRAGGRRRAAELLDVLDLTEAAGRLASTYSGGMKRRLDLAMTLLGRPEVIFLDEPTTGLDPRSRRTVWQLVRERVAAGVAILLTTQYLEEADHLADEVIVLDGGRVIAQGSPAELKRLIPGGRVRLRFADAGRLRAAAAVLDGGVRDEEALTLEVQSDGDSTAGIRGLLDRLDRAGIEAEGLSAQTADLDDVFLALTGHRTQVSPASDPVPAVVGMEDSR